MRERGSPEELPPRGQNPEQRGGPPVPALLPAVTLQGKHLPRAFPEEVGHGSNSQQPLEPSGCQRPLEGAPGGPVRGASSRVAPGSHRPQPGPARAAGAVLLGNQPVPSQALFVLHCERKAG